MLNGGVQILTDKQSIFELENIAMMIVWIMIFCGGVIVLASIVPIMNVNSVGHIAGILYAILCIGASLYYLNKRILGRLKNEHG